MEHPLYLMLPTAVDLFAITVCLGALGCRLWVLPPIATTTDRECLAALRTALWRLLALCLGLLIVSSLGELVGRCLTLSGLPLRPSLRVLPIILLRTHYGWVWCVRGAALVLLWVGWGIGNWHLPSRTVPAVMLGAAALLALTRSASGHGADWGDLSLPEVMDGLHLLAGALWGGGLLVLATTVLPVVYRHTAQRRTLMADIARRFAVLASLALAVVLVTGLYNAWQRVGTVQALGTTAYGRILLAKLLLILPLLTLGALNHYLSVPLLQQWAGCLRVRQGVLHALVMRWYVRLRHTTPQEVQAVWQWQRRVRAEGLCVAGVLLCTAVLVHNMPPHHADNSLHGHAARVLRTAVAPPVWRGGTGTPGDACTGSLTGELISKLANREGKIGRAIPLQEHLIILVHQKCWPRHTAWQDEQSRLWPVWERTTVCPAYAEYVPAAAGFTHLLTGGRSLETGR